MPSPDSRRPRRASDLPRGTSNAARSADPPAQGSTGERSSTTSPHVGYLERIRSVSPRPSGAARKSAVSSIVGLCATMRTVSASLESAIDISVEQADSYRRGSVIEGRPGNCSSTSPQVCWARSADETIAIASPEKSSSRCSAIQRPAARASRWPRSFSGRSWSGIPSG